MEHRVPAIASLEIDTELVGVGLALALVAPRNRNRAGEVPDLRPHVQCLAIAEILLRTEMIELHRLIQCDAIAIDRRDYAFFGLMRLKPGRGDDDGIADLPARGVQHGDLSRPGFDRAVQLGPALLLSAVKLQRSVLSHQ